MVLSFQHLSVDSLKSTEINESDLIEACHLLKETANIGQIENALAFLSLNYLYGAISQATRDRCYSILTHVSLQSL